MRLTDLLDRRSVKVPLDAQDKTAAIAEMVNLLADHPTVHDVDAVIQAVTQRELTRTTGIGGGLAIPHGKCAGVDQLVLAVGKPATPIDFQSIDEKPVDLIVLLISPLDQAGPHIQALARISKLMTIRPFRLLLSQADSAEAVYTLITEQDMAIG